VGTRSPLRFRAGPVHAGVAAGAERDRVGPAAQRRRPGVHRGSAGSGRRDGDCSRSRRAFPEVDGHVTGPASNALAAREEPRHRLPTTAWLPAAGAGKGRASTSGGGTLPRSPPSDLAAVPDGYAHPPCREGRQGGARQCVDARPRGGRNRRLSRDGQCGGDLEDLHQARGHLPLAGPAVAGQLRQGVTARRGAGQLSPGPSQGGLRRGAAVIVGGSQPAQGVSERPGGAQRDGRVPDNK